MNYTMLSPRYNSVNFTVEKFTLLRCHSGSANLQNKTFPEYFEYNEKYTCAESVEVSRRTQ